MGDSGPHADLPDLRLYTYRISQMTASEVNEGIEIDDETRDYAFDLNEFFATKSQKFVHEDDVRDFLRNLSTNAKYPFSTPELRDELRLSDIISVVMDIPGVVAIRDLLLNALDAAGQAIPPTDKWRLPVLPGRQPRLSENRGRLVFYKKNLPIPPSAARVAVLFAALREAERAKLEDGSGGDLPIPLGRYRDPARYRSFQAHFPFIYGLSEAGLPPGATPQRAAQALQFKAWLLFFDQVMANHLAQLAHVRDLFSTRPDLAQSYFSQLVDSFPDWAKVYAAGFDAARLADEVVEPAGAGLLRRNRFLDHLLARYAEDFHEYVAIMQARFGMGPARAAAATRPCPAAPSTAPYCSTGGTHATKAYTLPMRPFTTSCT